MKKKIIIVVMICIGFMIFNEIRTPFFFEYYIVDFENTKAQLTESEKNDLIKVLGLEGYSSEKPYFIEITKIAYEESPFNEAIAYILFKTNIDNVELLRVEEGEIEHSKKMMNIYIGI